MKEVTITIFVPTYSNWSASELMYIYARNNRGVEFFRDKYMKSYLYLKDKIYRCKSWTISPDPENEDVNKVTIYLEEI